MSESMTGPGKQPEAPKDETKVVVELKEERTYLPTGQTQRITVGPGSVEVPLWVAEEWGLIPPAPSDVGGGEQPKAKPS